MTNTSTSRQDIYTRVTSRIIADLEKGELTWLKPWNAEHVDGRISRPLRHNGEPYQGVNVILLWAACVECGYVSDRWMTYRQARELGGHVRKGERGETVVYADRFIRSEIDPDTGEEIEHAIPFMKAYTVFNVEQIDSLPERFYTRPEPVNPGIERDAALEAFFGATGADIRHGGRGPITRWSPITCRCRRSSAFVIARAITPRWRTR